MRVHPLSAVIAAAFAATTDAASLDAPSPSAAPVIVAGKKIITSADQLPRRTYKIPRLPSELLEAPRAELEPVVAAVDEDIAGDLATLEIRDRATRVAMLQARAQFAIFRGDWDTARAFLADVRSQQEKPADKLTSGVTLENILATRKQGGPLDAQRARLRTAIARSWAAMPWDVVGDNLKAARSGLELLSKELVISGMRSQLDPAAQGMGLEVPDGVVIAVVANRNGFEHLMPFRDDIVAVLKQFVDSNGCRRQQGSCKDAGTP